MPASGPAPPRGRGVDDAGNGSSDGNGPREGIEPSEGTGSSEGTGVIEGIVWVCSTCTPAPRPAEAEGPRDAARPGRSDEASEDADEPQGPSALLSAIRHAIESARLPARVAPVECLGACAHPVAIGFSGPGRAHYVFAGLRGDDAEAMDADAEAVVASVRAWLGAERGWIEDARACGRLRHYLRARIPSAPVAEPAPVKPALAGELAPAGERTAPPAPHSPADQR